MKKTHLIAFSTSFGLILASIAMTIFFWNSLPAQTPTHFGFSGTPDAWTDKNIVYAFMIPAIQLAITLLFIILYRKPQYSSWPTTLILMTVEEKKREKIYDVLRGMMALMTVIMGFLFAYLQFSILATANGRINGLSTYVMIGVMIFLVAYIFYYNIKMYVTVHKLVKQK